jgi:predicted acetyltransferase
MERNRATLDATLERVPAAGRESVVPERDHAAPAWTLTDTTPNERPLLRRMFELYLHDFSGMEPADLDEEGFFLPRAEPWLARFHDHPGRRALLLRAAGKPAGFALVEDESPLPEGAGCRYLAAFFVLRAYRRRGLGRAMAREIFKRWPGRWQVLEIKANPEAQSFWRRVIGDITAGLFEERWISEREIVQAFTVRRDLAS